MTSRKVSPWYAVLLLGTVFIVVSGGWEVWPWTPDLPGQSVRASYKFGVGIVLVLVAAWLRWRASVKSDDQVPPYT